MGVQNSSFSNPARVSAFVSAIMAPQLNAAQHLLIETLLSEGFDTKLLATETFLRLTRKETAVRNAHPENKPRRPS
jgi:hypothetical protein